MAVPHLLKLVLHWSGYGEEGTIGWHFKGNAADHTPQQLATAAAAAVSLWGTNRTPSSKTDFCSLLTTPQSVNTATLYEYAVSKDPVTHKIGKATALGSTTVTGWGGTGAAMRGPLQECLVATLRTAQAGKSFRGRQYFPAHTMAMTASNALLDNAYATNLHLLASNMGPEAAQAIAGSLNISTLEWAVYSPTLDIVTVIDHVTVDNKADTQRRRAQSLAPTFTAT